MKGSMFLVPCNHFWLEMIARETMIIALCKFCKRRGEFSAAEWAAMALEQLCLNKPVRRL
jgi:hypothetical protein